MAARNTDIQLQKARTFLLLSKTLKKGDTWYLVGSQWYNQWKKYVGYDSLDTSLVANARAHPGPVDNSSILKPQTRELKENLADKLHYVAVPGDVWGWFLTWYSICHGQAPIARKVIEVGMFVKCLKVELYLIELTLGCINNLQNAVTKKFSRSDTMKSVEMRMRELFAIPESKQVRLGKMYMSNVFEPLDDPDNTVQEEALYEGEVVVIQVQNLDGKWSDPKNEAIKPVYRSPAETITMAPDPCEEIITCIICFHVMVDPRMLRCQHTFCHRCIQQLQVIERNHKQGIECPICRQFSLRKDIQSSLVVKQMIEYHFQTKQPIDVEYCKLHPSNKMEGRCIPCNTEICAKCKFEDHDVHPSETFDAAIKNILPEVTGKLTRISKHVEDIENSITSLEKKKVCLEIDADMMKALVQDHCNKLIIDIDISKNSAEKQINSKIELLQSAVNDRKQFVVSRRKTIEEKENAGLIQVLQETGKECDEMTGSIGKKSSFNLVKVSLERCDCECGCLPGRLVKRRLPVQFTKVMD